MEQLHGHRIATSSIEDGLDFACNLLGKSIDAQARETPDQAPAFLTSLTRYIQYRYASEFQLALEELAGIGNLCHVRSFDRHQFWDQLRWVADTMSLSRDDYDSLKMPTA
jgi:hypothetical protein